MMSVRIQLRRIFSAQSSALQSRASKHRGVCLADRDRTEESDVRDLVSELRAEIPYLIVIRGVASSRVFKLDQSEIVIGRSNTAQFELDDPGISREHCKVTRLEDGTLRLQDLGSTNGTMVDGNRVAEVVLHEGDMFQLGAGTVIKFTHEELLNEHLQEALYEAASKDCVTQIYNKKILLEQLRLEVIYLQRHQRPLSLCLIDVDDFHRVNQDWGEATGNTILASVAKSLSNMIRATDVFARYGANEFAVILRETDSSPATVFAERIREFIDKKKFTFLDEKDNPQSVRLTVSIGLTTLVDDQVTSPRELILAVEKNLEVAKQEGGNRVIFNPKTLK